MVNCCKACDDMPNVGAWIDCLQKCEAADAAEAKRKVELENRNLILEKDNNAYEVKLGEVDTKLSIMDKKSEQLPIISETLQHYANAIAEGAAENKLLGKKLNKLYDQLDSYNKLVCSSLDPDNLQGQAKEIIYKDKQKKYTDCFV